MNDITISGLFELLGCPMSNFRYSWSGFSASRKRAIFTLWENEIKGGNRYRLLDSHNTTDPRRGAKELARHCEQVLADSKFKAYGILQRPTDEKVAVWTRAWFDRGYLRPLKLYRTKDGVFAEIGDPIPSLSLVKERVRKPSTAVADLDSTPAGNKTPDRASGISSGYERDQKVREFVIRRAKGTCEYCGKRGFKTTKGEHFLEAHHIIGLARQGPDTVDNVIALCPNDHREAHFGERAEDLERGFLEKIKARNNR